MKFNNKITTEKYDCLITSKGEFICLDRIDDRVIIAEDHQHHGAGNTRNYHCGRSHNTEDK